MKNVFILKKQNNSLLLKDIIPASETILMKIDNLIKNTWINDINKNKIEFNKNDLIGIRKIKDTTRLFVVENECKQIIASSAIHLNEKIDDCVIKHKINNLLTFPNYYFMGLAVDKDYQGIGLGKLLVKYRCDFVKTTNIKYAYCFVSKSHIKNVQNNGFILLENYPSIFKHRPGEFYPYILKL